MPKGYVIVTGTIHDPEGMKAYNRLASRTISEGGGKVLVVDTKPEVLEGDWRGSQTVVLEFASVDAARAWYESEGYQKLRRSCGRRRRTPQRGDPLGLRGLARQRALSSETA